MMTETLFQRLKPICIKVTKDCTVQHLKEAHTVFKTLENKVINEIALLEYVLFPFRITLQKRKLIREEQEIECFRCLQIIFSKCHASVIRAEIISWCLNTFSLYFAFTDANKDNGNKGYGDISEEEKIELVKLVLSVFNSINCDNMLLLYQEKYMPVIGHVVTILLNFIEIEKNRELQVMSLNCLKTLSGFSFNDKLCTQSAGKCWASFLPGICMTFNRLLTLKDNIGQNVLVTSLETFGYIIYVVLNDDLNAEFLSKEMTLEELFSSKLPKDDKVSDKKEKISRAADLKSLQVARTCEWIEKTTTNLNIVLKNILHVVMCHQKVKVKIAVLEFVEQLLLSCTKTLSLSVMDFLDVMVNLSCDETNDVRNEARRVLELAMDTFQNGNIKYITNLLNEKLYNELLSLPRVMNSSSDDLKLTKLQMIKGYMEFYGSSLKETLYTYSMLERFVMSLVHILELEHDNVNLVEERTSIFRQALDIGSEMYDNRFYRKNFKFFRNITIHKLIKEIIYLLAKNGNVELIIDYLLEQSENSSLLRKQCFLIINEIVLGMCNITEGYMNSIVELILSVYLDEKLLKLPVSNKHVVSVKDDIMESDEMLIVKQESNKHSKNMIPFEVLNNNIQLICILLEGISNCAQILKNDFNDCLIQTLYPILEKVGSVNAAVSYTAIETMNDIVRFCGYRDASDLIFLNSDYLLNSVTLQFRRLFFGTAAPAVLCVVLRFCNASLIPIISDVIGDVFETLDDYQEEVADDMLTVLKFYNIAIDKCYTDQSECKQTTTNQSESKQTSHQSTIKNKYDQNELTNISNDDISVASFVEEYCKLKLHAQGIINENEYSDDVLNEEVHEAKEDDEIYEKKDEIPLHYRMVITSLEKCVAYIGATDPLIKLKALDVVLHGVNALKHRENDLLPLIHKLWPAIIHRLKDHENVLVLKTLDVVCTMVEYSGNFITKRMTTDFLPYALQFLQENAKTFTQDKSCFTQLCKTQKKLITFLGDIVPTLNVTNDLFCSICCTVIVYINNNLHVAIQEAAVSTLGKFYTYKPNVMWLLFQSTYKTDDWLPPHDIFKPLNFQMQNVEMDHYQDNILKFHSIMSSRHQTVVL